MHPPKPPHSTSTMSEPIPESIPTSADPRSKRPTKKRALTPRSEQASQVEALFAKPDREIQIPGSTSKHLAPPPEIVANVQGSSAGAGSGEFHVYKASRRREYERLRAMDDEVKKEEDEREFTKRKEEQAKKDKEKTDKNRAKREKIRLRKEAAKNSKKGNGGEGTAESEATSGKKKIVANVNALKDGVEDLADDHNEGGEVKNAEEIGLVIEDDD